MTRIRTHTNPFNIKHRLKKTDFNHFFSKFKTKLDLEVGFGRGVFLRHWAKLNPERFILGVEIRKSIVQLLQKRLQNQEILNALAIHSTAQICLEDIIEDNSLENIFIFHPDPWFKKKHHKRRVINNDFLSLCNKKLKSKGKIYISTDVKVLYRDIYEQIKENNSFNILKNDSFWNSFYKTHWDSFANKDNRERNCLTLQKP